MTQSNNKIAVYSIIMGAALSLTWALAEASPSGKTADGCTYSIINGKYLTDCSGKNSALKVIDATPTSIAAAPVTSYGEVPMRDGNTAEPAQAPFAPQIIPMSAIPVSPTPAQSSIVVDRAEEQRKAEILKEDAKRARREIFRSQTYVGVGYGATTVKESNAGSADGLTVSVGTNLDDVIGLDFFYSYSKQKLNLGLNARPSQSENTETTSSIGSSTNTSGYDAKLSSHLFCAEVKGYFTPSFVKFRPYLGGGFGLKKSNLTEQTTTQTSFFSSSKGGELSQQTLGLLGSAGIKFQFSKKMMLAGDITYFAPVSRQVAQLKDGSDGINNAPSKLDGSDSRLTGSSQFQILGSLQYLF